MSIKTILLSLLLCGSAFAALPTTTVFEVHEAGNNTNAGCFITGSSGTDRSQQDAAQTAFTDLVAATTTTITSAGHPFGSTDVGNCIRLTSGTGWTTGLYYVVSVSGTTATMDRAIATSSSTGGHGNLGGALATLGQINTDMCQSCTAWVKADATYNISTGISFNYTSVGFTSYPQINGYTSTRGDNGRPTIKATTGFGTLVNLQGNQPFNQVFRNFILDCNLQSNTTGLNFNNVSNRAENIKVQGCALTGVQFNNVRNVCFNCEVSGTGGGGGGAGFSFNNTISSSYCIYCWSHDNTGGPGFSFNSGFCIYCVSNGNKTNSNQDGFLLSGPDGETVIMNSVAFDNGRDGIRFTPSANEFPFFLLNTIMYGNAGYGFDIPGITVPFGGWTMDYNAYGGNTSGAISGASAGTNDVTLTGNPFTSSSTGDFSLNATAGAGAALKNVGLRALPFGTGGNSIGPLEPIPVVGGTPHNAVYAQ